MRIGLNATCFNDRPSGARQRFTGIYGALVARRPDIEFVVYEPADCNVARWFCGAANVVAQQTPIPSTGRLRRIWRGRDYWPTALRADSLDLFEVFSLPLVQAPDCPTILTIHDLRSVTTDQPLPARIITARVMQSAFRRADQIVTVSRTMNAQIRSICPRARVTTIYNGVDLAKFGPASSETALPVRSAQPFLLAVGHLEARKNYGVLIEAISRLMARGVPVPLIIVGNEGGEGPRIAARISELGVGEFVTVRREVGDTELLALYRAARMIAFPSHYEGFGIPILEAMASHRPIVLSDIPVFHEIAGDAGAYFPAGDADAMADVIGRVWKSESERESLVRQGDGRLPSFVFDALAAQLEALYETVSGGRARRDNVRQPPEA